MINNKTQYKYEIQTITQEQEFNNVETPRD